MYDKDYKFLNMGWQVVPATSMTKATISIPTVNITQPGYIFVYLSYENQSNNYVCFDDFKVTHTKTNILQYNEYYPFGLQTANSWTRDDASNKYLYNGGNELNENSGWYETFFRGYDAALGRFMQVDPLASLYNSHSPYHFAYNNPVMFNDPFGAESDSTGYYPGGGTQRFGPGSGNYWSDGSKYSDWSANGGSQMYRDGLAAGLVDIGGTLYDISDGYRTPASEHNGQLGMYYDSYTDWYVNGQYVDSYYSYTYFKPFGDPNIQSFVNPLSFDLSNVFGRYVSYVNYNEIYADIFDPANLKTYDQLNIRLDRIALSVRTKVAYDDPNVIFMLASAFDEARFKVFDEFDQRSIFNMMTDAEGEKKFMTYLNESLQHYFPSPTTFAKVGHELISVGEPPSSTITFVGPYFSPN